MCGIEVSKFLSPPKRLSGWIVGEFNERKKLQFIEVDLQICGSDLPESALGHLKDKYW